MQDRWFSQQGGDDYYARNKASLTPTIAGENDIVMRVLEVLQSRMALKPTAILDIGACNGWRSALLKSRYRCRVEAVEPSWEACQAGRKAHPNIEFHCTTADKIGGLIGNEGVSLVVVAYCLHWIDRSTLLPTLAELDRVLAFGGILLINDFLPSRPTKVPYAHKEGLWTYKADYAAILVATGRYQEIERVVYRYHGEAGEVADEYNRAVCVALRKGDYYEAAVQL